MHNILVIYQQLLDMVMEVQLQQEQFLLRSGGNPAGNNINNIEYVTIASSGNAQDFGDLRHFKLVML